MIRCPKPNGENSIESSNACVEMICHEIMYETALHVGVKSSRPFMHVTLVVACQIQCIVTFTIYSNCRAISHGTGWAYDGMLYINLFTI